MGVIVVVGESVARKVVVPLVKSTHWCPLNQIQHRLHLWDEIATRDKDMPQLLVNVVYRISSDSHLTLSMLLIVTRFGLFTTHVWSALGDIEVKAFIGLCLFAGLHQSNDEPVASLWSEKRRRTRLPYHDV